MKASIDTGELGERRRDGTVGDADLAADRDRRKGVLYVVNTGCGEIDREIGHPRRFRGEAHPPADIDDVDGAKLRVVGDPVGHHRLHDLRQDRANIRIVDAEHSHAVERKPLDEVD